ncbi:MAG: hypothetical protein ACU0A6_11555 [Shimia sp.]|jgi:chromosome segregation ATPase|uniref:hypothetical protein n=1 Tax=Shimia sp. TaxID=1954381 RepID=UPI004058C747
MSEISDLESRLSAALERIGRGVAAFDPVSGARDETTADNDMSEELSGLRRALEHEANTSAQLEERLRTITQRQNELESELALEKEAHAKALEAVSEVEAKNAEVETLRATIDQDSAANEEADVRIETLAEQIADLEAQLETEKASRLAAETSAEGARHALAAAGLGDGEESLSESREAMEQMAQRLRRMRRMSKGVRENNERLRAAAEDKVVDATLINDALKAEIDSLKAQREAEMAEASVILTGLAPMLAVADTDTVATDTADAEDA